MCHRIGPKVEHLGEGTTIHTTITKAQPSETVDFDLNIPVFHHFRVGQKSMKIIQITFPGPAKPEPWGSDPVIMILIIIRTAADRPMSSWQNVFCFSCC